jgi:hypothetical protein
MLAELIVEIRNIYRQNVRMPSDLSQGTRLQVKIVPPVDLRVRRRAIRVHGNTKRGIRAGA